MLRELPKRFATRGSHAQVSRCGKEVEDACKLIVGQHVQELRRLLPSARGEALPLLRCGGHALGASSGLHGSRKRCEEHACLRERFLLLYETLDNSLFIKDNDWIEELVWSGIWDGAWTSTAFPTSKPAARPAEAHVL